VLLLTQNSNLSFVFDNAAVKYDKNASNYDEVKDLWSGWMNWVAMDKVLVGQSAFAKQILSYAETRKLDAGGFFDENICNTEVFEDVVDAISEQNQFLGLL